MVKSGFCILISLLIVVSVHAQQTITLHQSVQLAKSNNPELKVLAQNIAAAEADVRSAKLRPNPLFNVQTLHISNSRYMQEGTSWLNGINNQYWYQLTKPILIAGQRSNRIGLSEQLATQARYDFHEAARTVYVSVASQWITVWAAKVNLDILLKGKINIDSLVLINEYRLKNQFISETDLFRTQLLQQQYQRDIVEAQLVLANEMRNLQYLLGTTDSLVIIEDKEFFMIHPVLDSSIAYAGLHRPDVLSARSNVEASVLNRKLQYSLAYPTPELGGIFNTQNRVPYAGIYGTLEIPFFDRNQGAREKALVLNHQAEQNLFATKMKAQAEVTNAFTAYTAQRANLLEYEKNLARADQILSNVRYSYLRGATTMIDLLEAERSWLDTQQRYYSTMEDFRRSYVLLLYATGSINQLAE